MAAGSEEGGALEANGLIIGAGARAWFAEVEAVFVGLGAGLEKAAGAFPLGGPEKSADAESLDVLATAHGDANMADAEGAAAATGD